MVEARYQQTKEASPYEDSKYSKSPYMGRVNRQDL